MESKGSAKLSITPKKAGRRGACITEGLSRLHPYHVVGQKKGSAEASGEVVTMRTNSGDSTANVTPEEALLREYETVVNQIIHFNDQAWTKARFYFTVEVAFLGYAGLLLREALIGPEPSTGTIYATSIVNVIANILFCYIWFRSARSNREWLVSRLHRAMDIEKVLSDRGLPISTFQYAGEYLKKEGRERHSSGRLETYLGLIVMMMWVAIMIMIALEPGSPWWRLALASALLGLTFAAVAVMERTGYPASGALSLRG